jgi:SpoVK/Ycf46/Vps4 family AAA+-type ATPase
LPPEFAARFDAIFFCDAPDQTEREKIVAIHLRKRKRDPSKFDLKAIAERTDGFSGREIERGVKESLYSAFESGDELTTDYVLDAFSGVRPLSETRKAEIEAMKLWAKNNAISANKRQAAEGRSVQPEV